MTDDSLPRNDGSLIARLLSAGDRDEPSPDKVRKLLVSAGVLSGISTSASVAGASATGPLFLAKWVGVGLLAGTVVSVGGGALVEPRSGQPASSVDGRPSGSRTGTSVRGEAPSFVTASAWSSSSAGSPRTRGSVAVLPSLAPTSEAAADALDGSVPGDTLLEEASLVQRASSAVRRKDGPAALRALAEYRRRFPRGKLTPEASILEIDALWIAGQRSQARALANEFLATHPSSPSAERLRGLLREP